MSAWKIATLASAATIAIGILIMTLFAFATLDYKPLATWATVRFIGGECIIIFLIASVYELAKKIRNGRGGNQS